MEREEYTFGEFAQDVKEYLYLLSTKPSTADINERLRENLKYSGYNDLLFFEELVRRNIIIQKEKIKTDKENGKDVFQIQYAIPKTGFRRKLERLYRNTIQGKLNEDGGATSCVDMGPTPIAPLGNTIITQGSRYNSEDNKDKKKKRKSIRLTKKQLINLMEMTTTTSVGNMAYDAPGLAISKDDEAMVHNKKGGISCDTIEDIKKD